MRRTTSHLRPLARLKVVVPRVRGNSRRRTAFNSPRSACKARAISVLLASTRGSLLASILNRGVKGANAQCRVQTSFLIYVPPETPPRERLWRGCETVNAGQRRDAGARSVNLLEMKYVDVVKLCPRQSVFFEVLVGKIAGSRVRPRMSGNAESGGEAGGRGEWSCRRE